MNWLADQIIHLMPLENVRRAGYYDVGDDGQPRGLLQEAYKNMKSLGTLITPAQKMNQSGNKKSGLNFLILGLFK